MALGLGWVLDYFRNYSRESEVQEINCWCWISIPGVRNSRGCVLSNRGGPPEVSDGFDSARQFLSFANSRLNIPRSKTTIGCSI